MPVKTTIADYWYRSAGGDKLSKNHGLDTEGIWEIFAEPGDSAYGSLRRLAVVEGRLEHVIGIAISLDDFFTYGQGGTIEKLDVKSITEMQRVGDLHQRRVALREQLQTIEEQIRNEGIRS
jgi:hypothetical protein